MKKLMLTSLFVLLISGCSNLNPKEIPNEVIVIVELIKNKEKSQEELREFTKRYSDYVKSTESNTLGWTYHDAGDKIILIERYKNEDANIVTAKNISPDGIRYKLLKDQLEIFTVEKVSVFGAFTKKLINYNAMTAKKLNFNFPFEYNPMISGYSKNVK